MSPPVTATERRGTPVADASAPRKTPLPARVVAAVVAVAVGAPLVFGYLWACTRLVQAIGELW